MILKLKSEKHGDQECLIDDDDYDLIKNYTWYPKYDKKLNGFYACTNIRIDKNKYTLATMSRILLPVQPGQITDHINHNTLDNRRCNIRICTKAENNRNKRKHKNGLTSQYKGVYKITGKEKFGVSIYIDGKQKRISQHRSERMAALQYNRAAKKYYGEFASLNIIRK
jgi:hypothetical protein